MYHAVPGMQYLLAWGNLLFLFIYGQIYYFKGQLTFFVVIRMDEMSICNDSKLIIFDVF